VGKNIERVDKTGKPWFVTMMTTGTHQPYSVPPGYKAKFKNSKQAAFHALDDALKDFLQRLDRAGILDKTMVVVTGDESAANIPPGGLSGLLYGNWGAMLIKTPEPVARISGEYLRSPM